MSHVEDIDDIMTYFLNVEIISDIQTLHWFNRLYGRRIYKFPFASRKIASSKKSPTGPTERTPQPEYLIARSQLTERGPWDKVPFNF